MQQKHSDKAAAWDLVGNEFPVDPNFRWVTMDCEVLTVKEMATSHIFNCLKMIWNHTMPESARILPYTEYRGAKKKPKGYWRDSICNFHNELLNRPDRTQGMNEALARMAEYVKQHDHLLLKTKV